MYITNKGMEISFGEDDMHVFESLLLDAKHGIEQSIKEHYNSTHHDHYGRGVAHAEGLLLEQKGNEIRILHDLLARFGRNSTKQDLLDFLKEDYKKQHETNQQSK